MKFKILKIFLVTMLSVLVLVVIFLLLLRNDTFVLKAVRIYNNQYVTKSEILQRTDIDFSANLFSIDVDKIEKDILQLPIIDEVRVTRFYPSILNIRIKEYDLIAGISGSEVVAVTENGKLIYEYNPKVLYDLPIVTGIHFEIDSTGIRKPQNPKLIKKGVQILKVIKKNDPLLFHDISELNFSQDKGMIFFLRKNNIPVIFGDNHFLRKLNYFSTIFYELVEKKQLNNILALDMRYEGQVVVKQK